MDDDIKERLAVPEHKIDTVETIKNQLHSSNVVTNDHVQPVSMHDLINRFEHRHYSPHDDFLNTCRDVWSDMDISDAPDGDDVKTTAAVDTFARLFVQRYETPIPYHMSNERTEPSLRQRFDQTFPRTSKAIATIRTRTKL